MGDFQVVGIGHSCVDRICMVENYPKEDGSTHITSINTQGGGAVATAIVALSRLGVDSAFIGNIGYDSVSDEAMELFRMDGVSTEYIKRRNDCHGLESFVMVNQENGSRTKFPQRDTNPDVDFTSKDIEAIRNARIIHLDGTNWNNAIKASAIAREHGTLVSLDGCSMQKDNEKNIQLARSADILIMNRKYPLCITGKSSHKEALLEIAGWGPKVVICTLGIEGSLAVVDGKVAQFSTFKDNPVVDTTGAGDVFHGAFIASFLSNGSLEENIRFASAASTLKCMRVGGRRGIPTREEVIGFLNRQ